MIKGVAKFNSVVVGEFEVKFTGPTVHFVAKAAFVDSRTGHSHGWTQHNTWSPETIALLKQLRAAMERDLGRTHFEDGWDETAAERPSLGTARDPDEGGGLSEHLAGKQV